MAGGAKTWYFPDGYLPEKKSEGEMEAHEALMLLNTSENDVDVKIDIYFDDQEPIRNIPVTVGAERVKTLRLDNPDDFNGINIPLLKQYSLRISAEREIVAQFGRLDTTQVNMAYYGAMGYWE